MVAGIVLGAAAYFTGLNGCVAVHVGQCKFSFHMFIVIVLSGSVTIKPTFDTSLHIVHDVNVRQEKHRHNLFSEYECPYRYTT